MNDYDAGRHDERRRTMQLIGSVRMDAQTGASGDVLDKLVMCIASEPLPAESPRVPEGEQSPVVTISGVASRTIKLLRLFLR